MNGAIVVNVNFKSAPIVPNCLMGVAIVAKTCVNRHTPLFPLEPGN